MANEAFQFDDFNEKFLKTWLKTRFHWEDTENMEAAYDAILRLVSQAPNYWLKQSWSDLLRKSDFVEIKR